MTVSCISNELLPSHALSGRSDFDWRLLNEQVYVEGLIERFVCESHVVEILIVDVASFTREDSNEISSALLFFNAIPEDLVKFVRLHKLISPFSAKCALAWCSLTLSPQLLIMPRP